MKRQSICIKAILFISVISLVPAKSLAGIGPRDLGESSRTGPIAPYSPAEVLGVQTPLASLSRKDGQRSPHPRRRVPSSGRGGAPTRERLPPPTYSDKKDVIVLTQPTGLRYNNESLDLMILTDGSRNPRSANITNPFTNIYEYKFILFAAATGKILIINSNGTVTTEIANTNPFGNPNPRALLNIYSVSNNPPKTVFQSLAMGMYLCLDRRGILYSTCNRNDECAFNYTLLPSNYNVIESINYRNRYLTFNTEGTLKRARRLKNNVVTTRNYFLPGYIPSSRASQSIKEYFNKNEGNEALQHCANYNNGLFPDNSQSRFSIITERPLSRRFSTVPPRFQKGRFPRPTRRKEGQLPSSRLTTTTTTTTTISPPTSTRANRPRKSCKIVNGKRRCKLAKKKCRTRGCRKRRRRLRRTKLPLVCRKIENSRARRRCVRRHRKLNRVDRNRNNLVSTTESNFISNEFVPTRESNSVQNSLNAVNDYSNRRIPYSNSKSSDNAIRPTGPNTISYSRDYSSGEQHSVTQHPNDVLNINYDGIQENQPFPGAPSRSQNGVDRRPFYRSRSTAGRRTNLVQQPALKRRKFGGARFNRIQNITNKRHRVRHHHENKLYGHKRRLRGRGQNNNY